MNAVFEIVFMSVIGVFLAMLLLTVVLYIFRALGQTFSAKKKNAHTTEIGVNEETLVLLTAAAYAAIKKPVRIYKVHIHREPYVERWSYAGRMDIHLSHQKSGVNQ